MYGSASDSCDTTSFLYPMLADVYYAIITQNEYGKAVKDWVFDRTITCNAQPITKRTQEEISPAVFLQSDGKLIARSRTDIRTSTKNTNTSITNILITNVRLPGDNIVYRETAGIRNGRGTIFEVATLEPFVGGLQSIEYYYMMWRRSENQTVED
jgi:hypothetical protein